MSNLDDELAKAVADAPAPDSERPVAVAPKGDTPRGNVGLLVGLLVAGGAILALVMSFRDAAVYAKSVSQLTSDKHWTGRAVRVEGDLVNGSLEHHEQPCEYTFRIAEGTTQLPVRYANCVVPDTFRDVPGTKVTVEGKLTEQGEFEATLVMAKCPSKYEMNQRAQQGETVPHGAMPPRTN